MAPWWPAGCRAWLGGLCAAWWPVFQPHLAAAVPGSELSPFVRRHIAVVASERTGCLISQLRREPPHFSKCRQKICLLLLSPIPRAPGLWVQSSHERPGPEGGWLVNREVAVWLAGAEQRWVLLPGAQSLAGRGPSLQPCGSGPAKAMSGSFLLLFPERFHSCDSLCSQGVALSGLGGYPSPPLPRWVVATSHASAQRPAAGCWLHRR